MSFSISAPAALLVSEIRINPIGAQSLGFPFIVGGTFYYVRESVELQVSDDKGAFRAPPRATVEFRPSTFTFTHPGITTPGEHVVSVGVAGTKLEAHSNAFVVSPVYD
jgi:hypothetical protein